MNRRPAPELPDWLSEMVPFDRYMVEVDDGIEVHVMEVGAGRPVVAFHGNPTWGFLYRKVATGLTDTPVRIIMPDLVGLGFSTRVRRDRHNLENHAGWMSSLLTELDIRDAVALVQDWGGPIGVHSFIEHPERLAGLVVMNTSISPPREGFKPSTFHRVFSTGAGEFLARYLGLPHRRLGAAQGDRKSISGNVQRAYNYALSGRGDHEAVVELVRMVPDSQDHPTVAGLRRIADFVAEFSGPSAIVWGQKDPVLGRLMNRVSRQLPGAPVTATDAGHFLQEEVPDEIVAAVKDVLNRI